MLSGTTQSEADQWDGHLLLFHASEVERRTQMAAWVRRGLARDEKIVWTLDPSSDQPTSPFDLGLDEQGIDLTSATAGGQLGFLPITELYAAEEQPAFLSNALAEGFSGIRVATEMSTALKVMSFAEYATRERNTDRMCISQNVSVLCQYNMTEDSSDLLDGTTTIHVSGVRERDFYTIQLDGSLNLCGDVDLNNEPVLGSVVRSALSANPQDLRLDLSHLRFLSVGGFRQLAQATDEYRRQGGRVILVRPRPAIERLARLLDANGLMTIET